MGFLGRLWEVAQKNAGGGYRSESEPNKKTNFEQHQDSVAHLSNQALKSRMKGGGRNSLAAKMEAKRRIQSGEATQNEMGVRLK
ncbi:MAG: hypothetical protein HQL50_12455 [Magnetococcales bacterium]|nr:hypothetical protein [Magnetococcales bacterium]